MRSEETDFIIQAIRSEVNVVNAKIEHLKSSMEQWQEQNGEKFHELFTMWNEHTAPTLRDVKWIKIILGGCWTVALLLLGEFISRAWR